jgi:chemotaxis protein methyltransferase CheR
MDPLRSSPPAAPPAGPDTDISAEDYLFLLGYIHRESGIALGNDKQYLLRCRLKPLVAEQGLGSLHGLCQKLRLAPSADLRRRVVEAMTTHETLFFRDAPVYDSLRHEILPLLAGARAATTRTLRIWSAACSSGQEPYSLAMLLIEAGYGGWNLQILGTDLSTQILDRARQGRYFGMEVNRGLPAPLLARYFEQAGTDWRVKEEVRRLVRFEHFDLRNDMRALGPFDLVLCRNVLIYFDDTQRARILAGLGDSLVQGGYLLLGTSETTASPPGMQRRNFKGTIAYQRG